ncbi:FAD-binding domain-containing protein [Massarina eburnea CBS 473.64]|uniref:D-lactate dehydrogenase (cytochrome) n=1 Tax=Massarina eburnea CBS 473.64 TaxID=1395130 RepID=A0A6A6SBR4_9PLEO|nr:FAD-binding domain-containing protein [Massarina eburnea CBS 473.64]
MPSPTPSPPTHPLYNHTPTNITSLITTINHPTPIPGTRDPETLASRSSTPHSPAPLPHQVPHYIFFPRSTDHVSRILKACHEKRVAVTSFAGGTSLGGAVAALWGGVCVDFGDMDAVGEVWWADLMVEVQAGVGWVALNRVLGEGREGDGKGLFWPVDPALGARVGGMIAMSCSGTNAYRYGTIKNWIISMTVVLANGTIIKTRNRPLKSSAGYDLNHLIIGSEGTLALVTEAVLNSRRYRGICMSGLLLLLLCGMVSLEAIELADREAMFAIEKSGLARGRVWDVAPTLFLKFAGSEGAVREQIEFVREMCARFPGGGLVAASNEMEFVDTVWGGRKCLANALVAMKNDPGDLFLSTDAAVPSSKMALLVEESNRIVREEGDSSWFCASVGHVGDGNVHTAIVCPAAEKDRAGVLVEKIQRLALELEGTITGEHGVGLKLRDLLEEEVGKEGVDVMRKIKFALDPRGILNPDKVVRLEAGY